MDDGLDSLLECAVLSSRAAGDYALSKASRRGEIVTRFSHDLKLQLDHESQAEAERVIRSFFPNHAILGEESRPESGRMSPRLMFAADAATGPVAGARIEWIIDPIDGTVNFRHGLPLWCSTVAACADGRVVAGSVYAPALGECYTAAAGRPALCNGKPIGVSETANLSDAMIATGLPYESGPDDERSATFSRLMARAHKARVFGSAALDLCLVARGLVDGYFETRIYVWDIAAGGLIVRQAGGREEVLAELPGDHLLSFMATNGRVHEELKGIISPEA